MNRKSLTALLIWLTGVMLLAGCGRSEKASTGLKEEVENVSESTDDEGNDKRDDEVKGKQDEKADNDGNAEEISGEKQDKADAETIEPAKTVSSLDLAGAFREGMVYNNGNYFIRIRDKVYFRNIRPESMEEGATFGEFLHTEFYTINCPLISYDVNTCEWEEIGTVAGTGELYACPEGFYIGEIVPDMFDASCTNLYDPETGETTLFCRGLPLGVSQSGELLAVEESGSGETYTVLYKDGREIARIGGEDIYYNYVGFSGENLITILRTADYDYILCSVDETGDVTELGRIGNADNGYGVPRKLLNFDGYVYVCLGYYEGTGNFLSRWEVVKARPGVSGSLEMALNGDEVPGIYDGEGPDPDVPVIYFDETGNLDYNDHIPYNVYMGDGDNENDLFYYNEIYDECLLVKDFIDRSDYEKCSIIQDMESIAETAFIIYADAEADSEYDIGWRMGYRMTGWHICAIPFYYDHLDEKGLAKNIIYFQDTDVNNKEQSDKGNATENPDNEGDPLEELVADDILAEFRGSNPAEYPGSVEAEADALGRWVQENIGNIPKDIREAGEEIGQNYEFWFGTDVANNFDANLPRIYATYYSLKDYYTSDGKRSRDFYNGVMEENGFLGNGDPENIEKMYTDMQKLITDCNNIIRNK